MGSRTPSSVPGVLLRARVSAGRSSVVLSHVPGVSCQEVVAGLLRRQLTNGWENTESVASEHDDVGRLLVDQAGNPSVGDELDRVSASSVFSDANVIVIGDTVDGVVDDVLENSTETNGSVDLGFLLSGKVDALGVASTLDVEDTLVGPDMLVITDQLAVRVSGKRAIMRSFRGM